MNTRRVPEPAERKYYEYKRLCVVGPKGRRRLKPKKVQKAGAERNVSMRPMARTGCQEDREHEVDRPSRLKAREGREEDEA